jgi:hypothetical protein
VKDYVYSENRYLSLLTADDRRAEQLLGKLERDVQRQRQMLETLASGEDGLRKMA